MEKLFALFIHVCFHLGIFLESYSHVIDQLDFFFLLLSMTDEQAAVPSSPRDGETIAITQGIPKVR